MPNVPESVEVKRLHDVDIAEKVSLLCHIRKTPMVLYGIFTELIRQFYSNSDNLPIDVCVEWDSDPTKTKIWIDNEFNWNDEIVEFRPAIYIKLGQIRYQSMTRRRDGTIGMDLEEGEKYYARQGTGSVSWVHLGQTNGEAAALSGATLDFIDGFHTVIRDDFKFESFEVASIDPMALEKESKERFRSVVNARFSFQDKWSLKLEAPKLKRLVFRAGQRLVTNDNIRLIL